MKVLIFDWMTSIGGVQKLLHTVSSSLSKDYDLLLLDPYGHKYGKEICNSLNVSYIDRPIGAKPYIGWNRKAMRPLLLLKYGLIYSKYIFSLSKYLRKEEIELIYTHSKKGVIFSYFIFILTGIQYIYHAHGFQSHKDIGTIFKKSILSSKRVIAVSSDVKVKLIKAGVPDKNISLIYNGVNTDQIASKSKEFKIVEKNNAEFKIIFVGSIQRGKGIDILLEAFNKLLSNNYNCELYIVGKTPEGGNASYLESITRKSKEVDGEKVTFFGFQENVYPFIADSDVLVLPSIVEESFGLVLAEAMSLKKPVIGSQIGGISEVIEHGTNGFLFKAESSNDLYKYLEILYRDRTLREKLGSQAKEIVENKFNSMIQIQKIRDILR